MNEIWGLKIIGYDEDSMRIGKQGNTWDNGDKGNNATWDSSQLKWRGNLRFLEKKYHNF
jgi:hypothetical protein